MAVVRDAAQAGRCVVEIDGNPIKIETNAAVPHPNPGEYVGTKIYSPSVSPVLEASTGDKSAAPSMTELELRGPPATRQGPPPTSAEFLVHLG
eukprot:scaffold64247_cov47-Phaeocystis_antarctica.AAC.1